MTEFVGTKLIRRVKSVSGLCLNIICILTLTGCGIPLGADMWLQTRRYSGDGSIETCSNIFSSGYKITFPEFDSRHAYQVTYRLSNVPHVPQMFSNRGSFIYLCFAWTNGTSDTDWVRSTTTASVRVSVASGNTGRIRESFEVPLSSMVWSEAEGVFELADHQKSKLHFVAGEDYLLVIEYTPGTVPPPAVGGLFFQVKDCVPD
jgi:hypothetical protein